jgi:hypothetical protein
MPEADEVPPVPTMQIGPPFAFFTLAFVVGAYAVTFGLTHDRWLPLATGLVSGIGSAWFLTVGIRALRRLIRLNRGS